MTDDTELRMQRLAELRAAWYDPERTPVDQRLLLASNYIEALEKESLRVGMLAPLEAAPDYQVGDDVIVMDPTFGEKQGRIVTISDSGTVYVEGERIDSSRVFSWTVDVSRLREFVRPA